MGKYRHKDKSIYEMAAYYSRNHVQKHNKSTGFFTVHCENRTPAVLGIIHGMNCDKQKQKFVAPAKHVPVKTGSRVQFFWIPASAGMTEN